MAATLEPTDLQELEREVLENLDDDAGHVESDIEAAAEAEGGAGGGPDPEPSAVRIAVAIAFPTIAAAVMVGGVFTGFGARFYAAFAGILGIGLTLLVRRVRKPLVANLLIIVGLFAIGLILVLPTGLGNIASLRALVSSASATGDLTRPPVPLTPGWQAIIGWLLGIVGFVTAWLAIVVRRPSLALLVPMPVAALAGISVPKEAQVSSGLAVLVLFAIGLGLLASTQSVGEGDARPPLSYEIRKALRSLPLLALIVLGLYGLSKADFLFPKPAIDPTQEPQKPKTVPLSEVEDRVLFEVESPITGPWRIGSLDVYDGEDWRLPPFAQNEVKDVPRSGVVDSELSPGVRARFTVAGLGGAVLPALPNTVAIVAEGPRLAYDARNGNIRVAQGAVQAGLAYTVTAAGIPSVDELRQLQSPIPREMQQFARMPIDPPPAAQALIDQANSQFTNGWDKFDFLRTYVLDNVVSTGPGAPTPIGRDRLQEILTGSKEASPFEIVAAQAMFARWVGVPSRIGYGFDGGEEVGGRLQVRPKNGSTFVEVYFPGFKWLPVIGVPKQAKPTVGGDAGQQQFNPSILPSDDVTVQLVVPVVVPPASILGAQIKRAVLIGVPIALFLALLYVLFPWARKAFIRSRRRSAAMAAGPRARIALAYAEWRDFATDFGFGYATDTPLMFLDRFISDSEHTEFAWLVTRALWGDLQDDVSIDLAAAAEGLSRALRRRLADAQPATVRAVAAVSRLSLRRPYAPETDLTRRKEKRNASLVPA
ncbi:MAG: hypothetical protein QOF60_519 [Actinomycetota bacterium]|jgi:hypothetical protein|nr:hypothetical protein [Actinomycetota bacterium]